MVGIESQLHMNGINGYICMTQTRVNVQWINMSHGQNVRCDFLMYMLKKAFSWFLDKMGA
jgi:hypothetical protein